MALADITGREYGPIRYRIDPEKIADFIEASADDPARWVSQAPPGFAGALLFAVAPALLADPDLATHNHGVIHGDQSFRWHRPFLYGSELLILGRVSKLRERGGVAFLGFSMEVSDDGGTMVCDGESTFVLSGTESAASGHSERSEPGPDARALRDLDGVDLVRSASRRDLVKYAGASRDFNPLHWDHDTAVSAGLPGVVVHGLLQTAWILQATGPVASAKFRYRAPLLPATPVGVAVDAGGDRLQAKVTDGETDYVTAAAERAP
jgi:acyl dehydratase